MNIVSLLDSREQQYIKAINNIKNISFLFCIHPDICVMVDWALKTKYLPTHALGCFVYLNGNEREVN